VALFPWSRWFCAAGHNAKQRKHSYLVEPAQTYIFHSLIIMQNSYINYHVLPKEEANKKITAITQTFVSQSIIQFTFINLPKTKQNKKTTKNNELLP